MILNLMESVPDGYSILALNQCTTSRNYYVEIWDGSIPVRWGEGQTVQDAIDEAAAKVTVPARDGSA